MRVLVTHGIDDLAKDIRGVAVRSKADMARTVKKNVTEGHKLAQLYARQSSGPHGKNYYKRITTEMLAPLVGEYGPHGDVVGNAVGADWRGAPANNDLPRTLDFIGPKFRQDAFRLADKWFW